jgi:hypothetical protein
MMMRRLNHALTAIALTHLLSLTLTAQSVYPTGTTIYDPERAWSGYTVLSPLGVQAVVVIDMNGNVAKEWRGFVNSAGGPARILPGGLAIAASGSRPPHQESLELIQQDFDGNVIWRFDRNEEITRNDGSRVWSARQHHDWQRESLPAGYYSPAATPEIVGGRTLMLTHTNLIQPNVSNRMLEDDRLIEVSWEGDIVWEWLASDHIDEMGFLDDARDVIRSAPTFNNGRGSFDWIHLNSATYVGPNRWFDAGDERFAPDNIIVSSREASLIAIIDHDDGSIVWRLGPNFNESEATRRIGQIIGQHHPHLIPEGLPGAGNLLVFDNGGSSGYGWANPLAPNGLGAFKRSNSRVLEIDPMTLELVWSYAGPGFFSTNISNAQRLPNGNTLITAGAPGRLLEVTADGDIVWEYIYPEFTPRNAVYRGYRLPYDWIPQLDAPAERAVVPPDLGDFRVPE